MAGALQRKTYLQWGFETIFPNMYVVLVGPAGKTRKGVALGIAKDMLASVPGISIAPESSSGREALVLAMKRSLLNFEDPSDGKVKFHCSLTAISEEFSVFLGQQDIKFLANLTDWYDSKAEWEYESIGRGRDTLQGLCFNLFAATAPEWIPSIFPQEAIGGGFTSRVIFVVEERKGKTVPKHLLTQDELNLQASLQRDLERISQLKGQYLFTPEGELAYTSWYREQDSLLAKGQQAVEDHRFAAYCERRATHLRKLMILMSASRGDSLELSALDFHRALRVLKDAELRMHMTFGGLGKARHGDATDKVMKYIQAIGITTRSALLAKFFRDVDSHTLKEIEDTLDQLKVIKVRLLPDKNDRVYEWIGEEKQPSRSNLEQQEAKELKK